MKQYGYDISPYYGNFRAGCNTVKDLLPTGAFSWIQNMRQRHPGMEQRKGQIKLHTTADGTNEVVSLYQFSKGSQSELSLFAQMDDGDILKATAEPPGVTTGAFGPEVFSGNPGQVPASWADLLDLLIYSNGSNQHQIYPGTLSPVSTFIVYRSSAAIPVVIKKGEDFTLEVTDGDSSTAAILDSLGDLAADYDCVFIRTDVPCKEITFTVSKANGTASVAKMNYWNGAWTDCSITDGTIVSSCTLGQTGSVTFTAPSGILPRMVAGESGFWYQWYLHSGDLDSEVEVTAVTFEADFQDIVNVWDGIPTEPPEVLFRDDSETPDAYKSYGASSIDVSEMTTGDRVYFCSIDPIEGFRIDVGSTPNVGAQSTVEEVFHWDGDSWTAVTGLDDNTDGLARPGWVNFTRAASQPTQQFDQEEKLYWYYFQVSVVLSANVIISIQLMPYFDILEVGRLGNCCISWKDRMVYTFDRFPQFLYISGNSEPLHLNGSDFAILEAGDGRMNKVVAMRRFVNDLMVWQIELGTDGGCITMFQGHTPANFGKMVLSTKVGALSNKAVCVVDDALTSMNTTKPVEYAAYFISRMGVFMCNGNAVTGISDDIQNYFDPKQSECIRKGYEEQCWIAYDPGENVLRLGLVTGAGETPNIFPIFDLIDSTWSFDTPAQVLTCGAEVEAGSGSLPLLMVGGGNDGFIYLLNNSDNDVSTAIDAYADIEIDALGYVIGLEEIVLRTKALPTFCTITPILNGKAGVPMREDMTADKADELFKRNIMNPDLESVHFTLRFQNDTINKSIYLEDVGLSLVTPEND